MRTSTYGTLRPARDLVAYTEHNDTVIAAAISPDGGLAATGDSKEIDVWAFWG